MALCLFVSLGIQFCASPSWAVRPYRPVRPDPVLESWRWRAFPETKGLGLSCLTEAKDGAIWFGTDKGALRYDGIHWTAYTPENGLPGAPVWALCAARDGSVYAGAERGVGQFQDGTWRRIFPPQGDFPWPVDDLMEASDGSIWAGTAWGALRLKGGRATLYTTREIGTPLRAAAPFVQASIVPDAAAPARPWPEGIGARLAEGWWMTSRSGPHPRVITALAPDGPGEIAGLKVGDRILNVNGQPDVLQARIDGPAGTPVRLTVVRKGRSEPFEVRLIRRKVGGSYRDFRVYSAYEGRDGAMWFGLYEGEIVRYNLREARAGSAGAWRLYTEADGLGVTIGPHIAQTRDGAVWTASDWGWKGVNRFDGRGWTHFSQVLPGATRADNAILATGDGALWIGGYGGQLQVFRNGSWTVYRPPDVPLPSMNVFDLVEASDGALWIVPWGQEAFRLDYRSSRWQSFEGLRFQSETPDGSRWFLSQDGGAVRQNGNTWVRYGVKDGLLDAPSALIVTRRGEVWAVGSHHNTAATARFDPSGRAGRGQWGRKLHPRFSEGIPRHAVFEARDGALWFGAGPTAAKSGYTGGALRFGPSGGAGRAWTLYPPPEALPIIYSIGQTADGALWFGGIGGLRRFDGRVWTPVVEPRELTILIDVIYATPDGNLWAGTRTYGAFHYDGRAWTRYDVRDGLADNRVMDLFRTADGSTWAATARGVSRFDGRVWDTQALPSALASAATGEIRQSRDGALWINTRFGTVRYRPDSDPPDTEITVFLDEVSQPGNTVLSWTGADPWRATPDGELRYAWRLDGGDWSPFSPEKHKIFLSLPGGDHTFEVKARDCDFNEDPTPARIAFTVIPPVWRQPWFIGLMAVLTGAIGFQTGRVIRRGRRFREANEALSEANEALFEANAELLRDRALERVHVAVVSMKSTDSLKEVLEKTVVELAGLGVGFDLCVINLVDEKAGLRRQFGAVKGGEAAHLEMPISQASEEFLSTWKVGKPAVRQVDDALAARHIQTRKRLGIPGDAPRPTAILEVPFEHGTLSLSTARPEGFSEQEISLAERFAQLIARGYVRFLDIRRLEDQDRALERSRVLTETAGAAAHEINQPLTVLVGLAQMLLMRISPDDACRQDIEAIYRAGKKIAGIVKKMQEARQYATRHYVGDTDIVDFDSATGGEKYQMEE